MSFAQGRAADKCKRVWLFLGPEFLRRTLQWLPEHSRLSLDKDGEGRTGLPPALRGLETVGVDLLQLSKGRSAGHWARWPEGGEKPRGTWGGAQGRGSSPLLSRPQSEAKLVFPGHWSQGQPPPPPRVLSAPRPHRETELLLCGIF